MRPSSVIWVKKGGIKEITSKWESGHVILLSRFLHIKINEQSISFSLDLFLSGMVITNKPLQIRT